MKAIIETTIAHYRIMEPIGAGGMGAVYKAYDTKLQRVVALKLLPPEYISQQDRRRRFFQEARAASALNHPHILTVYEVGEDDGKPYIAMEYVEGETLRQKIKSRSLNLKDTLDISIQIAEAKLLDDVALDPSGATEGSNTRRGAGFVTLSRVHSAKGLEWDSLFVIWMTDGWFPSNRFRDEFDDLEEERRLLYVATTRAKRELHFVYPLNAYRYGENDAVPALSRFLEPIPATILPHASLSGGE
jgi:superfamily I DNA/RNA helicase